MKRQSGKQQYLRWRAGDGMIVRIKWEKKESAVEIRQIRSKKMGGGGMRRGR